MSDYASQHYDCIVNDGGCSSYRPGHLMHFIHANHIGRSPWGWRDGIVEKVGADGWITIGYVAEEGHPRVWHHADLTAVIHVGDPIRVHERFFAIGGRFGWICVELHDGLGAVPDPASPEAWAAESTVGVVNLSTGIGLALDHVEERQQ